MIHLLREVKIYQVETIARYSKVYRVVVTSYITDI